ncbi:MAG: phosphatidate cytidylyltransferase [Lachnospiraceae bacterium]|nr:phosphatidate cytidylyltransferase [Lachnospiraceae bacterium]
MSSFTKRLISGVVLVIMALLLVGLGGWYLWATALFLSLVGMFEMYRVFGIHNRVPGYIGYVTVLAYYIVTAVCGRPDENMYGFSVYIFGFLMMMSFYVFSFPRYKTDDIFRALTVMVYPGMLLACLYFLRMIEGGDYLVWLIFLSSWGNDTCAYCVGILCKKFMKTHPMTPHLSPKKTVEGLIGGLAGATILGMIYGAVMSEQLQIFKLPPVISCAILCFAGAVLSVVGDLAASAVKRDHDIKDYGNLIPGHGGVMDRFDSMTYSAPVLYFISLLLLAS